MWIKCYQQHWKEQRDWEAENKYRRIKLFLKESPNLCETDQQFFRIKNTEKWQSITPHISERRFDISWVHFRGKKERKWSQNAPKSRFKGQSEMAPPSTTFCIQPQGMKHVPFTWRYFLFSLFLGTNILHSVLWGWENKEPRYLGALNATAWSVTWLTATNLPAVILKSTWANTE